MSTSGLQHNPARPQTIVGRLAPSPTGAQHVGNARTYLLAWLSVRSQAGRLILRIEDIDSPRTKPGAARLAVEDLHWLGLDWDEGPNIGGPNAPYVQTERLHYYRDILQTLRDDERIYPCTCSRSDVLAAASAPHVGQEGPRYPGTCQPRRSRDVDAIDKSHSYSWRFRATDSQRSFHDLVAGRQSCAVSSQLGDFVVAKSDGSPAYQLAVVVDDHLMGVTEVTRGDDLLPSTFRQLELFAELGWTPPTFVHVPLVVGPDGRRLAKRHGDTRLETLRREGVRPDHLIGFLAWSSGLIDRPIPCMPQNLLDDFSWERVSKQPFVFERSMLT